MKKQQSIFFLHKDNAVEFQNRCVIALFLEVYPEVKFIEYLEENKFKGVFEGQKRDIYLFNDFTKKGSEPSIVFRSKNAKEYENNQYFVFNGKFKQEYMEYRKNVYAYILKHFFTAWKGYHKSLFISKRPEDGISFKYKQCKKIELDEKKSSDKNYFHEFIDGSIVFSNPKYFNDPFDCDCEMPDLKSKISLVRNAFNSTKYSGVGSPAVKRASIEKVLKDTDITKDNIAEIITRILNIEDGDKKSEKPRRVRLETIRYIADFYNEMSDQIMNLKEKFRVLCTGDKPNDILMWGYYCNGGDGVCCKYNRVDIINSIIDNRKNCICVYGDVKYRDKKTKYEYVDKDLADNIFDYVIKCIFTKHTGWEHEKEFRYVLMEELEEKGASDYISMDTRVQAYYLGCKLSCKNTKELIKRKGISAHRLEKSKSRYRLKTVPI